MPVTTIDYTAAGGASTVTTLDAGTYSVEQVAEGFHLPEYDYLTITYKTGGSGGITVATLTLTYSSGDLVSVAKA